MSDLEASGKLVAPTAGTAVATLASGSLPAGKYDVNVKASVSGSAAADEGNMGLYIGTDQALPIAVPTPSGAGGAWSDETYHGVTLDGTKALTVQAVANATSAIGYEAVILATRVA